MLGKPHRKAGQLLPPTLILIGAVLLIIALFTAWYSVAISVHGGGVPPNAQDTYLYAGFPSSIGTVREVCTGAFASGCSAETSYNGYGSGYDQAGMLAEYVYILLIAGIALALAAAALGLYADGNRRRVSIAVVVAIIAVVSGLAAPGLYAAALPTAIGNGMQYHSGSGPWSTFFGSNTSTSKPSNITGTITWGPGAGWFLSIGASVVLLAGLVMLTRARRGMTQAVSPTSSSKAVSVASTPRSSPPGP
jgi:hypothetical protein